jgi:phosphoenolpyruvate carboxykinase (ATP)
MGMSDSKRRARIAATTGGQTVTADRGSSRDFWRPAEERTGIALAKIAAMTDALLEAVDRKSGSMRPFSLEEHQIVVAEVHRNLPPSSLYEHAIRYERDASIAENGALVAYSGVKTGRSPKDKRIVRHPESEEDVWWGPVNIPCEARTFAINRQRAIDYLNTRERLYCFDGFAGWDPNYRIKVRVICSRPYHALFMHTMLIRPAPDELAAFDTPDITIYNAGAFPANRLTSGMGSTTSIALSLEDRELVILGTEYAGEMKKGVFTVANYFAPRRGILSMHCSATADRHTERSSLLFGLSGTGKTTLSADPKRFLIGDDEHCWSDEGIFNIEGGCYAKAINLTPEKEPDIFQALRFGAVLENVVLEGDRSVDYGDTSITENTRGAYPIEFIRSAKIPCVAGHPSDVIFLTCDAFGVLPPVSALSRAHAMYHFISGYTAKVAGTEVGVTEPQATFSPCFGGPFLVWHPSKYAELLATKMRQHGARVWLVNTGWSGGAYGTGRRISLAHTRAILDAIHEGALARAKTERDPVFGIDVVTECPGVPAALLTPRSVWSDAARYDAAAAKLAGLFRENFRIYESGVGPDIRAAGPA